MNDMTESAVQADGAAWNDFAGPASASAPAPAAAGAAIRAALGGLTLGRVAGHVGALAEPYKGRRVLYVGHAADAVAAALGAGGHDLTVVDAAAIRPEGGPYALAVLSAFALASAAAAGVVESLVASLAEDGALLVDDPAAALALGARTVYETAFAAESAAAGAGDGYRLARLGWQTPEAGAALAVTAALETAAGARLLAGAHVLQPTHRELERALADAGLIVVDRTAGTGERVLTFQRKSRFPLCYPLGALTLAAQPDKVLTLTEGQGCKVRDNQGNEYIDAGGGLWNTHIGLGNEEVIDAIAAQLRKLSYATLFSSRGNEPAVALAEALVELAPYPLQWAYLTGSGSESTELGIRLAVLHHVLAGKPERTKIAHLDLSYHGSFSASASVSALMPLKDLFQSNTSSVAIPTPDVARCPEGQSHAEFAYECADALEALAQAGDVAAFIVEPVLGSAGVIIPPREYFERIREICDRHDILLIADEVATGFGRTGHWFATEYYDLQPDILLLAKGINSGYLPLGAVLFSAAIGARFIASGLPLMHASTYNGHPVCCASALANLAILKRENLVERSAETGRYFRQALMSLQDIGCVTEVRGIGLMLALGIAQEDGTAPAPQQLQALMLRLQEAGVLAYQSLASITFCPALVITTAEIDAVVAALRAVLATARLRDGQVEWEPATAPLAAA